ncbi:TMEM165/GDT1 family protein [Chamaesiphon sp. VAR_48_metabat_135_sub]|uniref:TMEM165/GDT1 family protein n=1 Tax=Chamaesiphon sp. VAR_48_metabat_135_sub TaxID=2964699 RepID=UPI0037BF4C8E
MTSPSPPEIPANDLAVEPLENVPTSDSQKAGMWSTFFSTFITIFLAEMGDKTQLATLLLSAQSGSPWIVFIGAGSALIATSLVGVLLGRYLAKVLSPQTLDIAAGMLLMVISVLLLGDVVQL